MILKVKARKSKVSIKILGTFENLHLLVGTDSSIRYIRADCDFGYFVGYRVDLDSFGCFDSNFAVPDNGSLVR